MTDSILLATTRQRGLHAVGTAGQPVMQAYDQIARYLTQTLSPAHAALFAEPNPNAARGTVDWYTDASGPLTRFVDAGEEQQAAVSARLAELRDEIEARATQLTRSKEGGERFLGQMLKLALEIPGKEFVYVVGDQPILVCWGNLHDTPQAERGVLQRMVRAPAAMVPHYPAAAAAGAAGYGGAGTGMGAAMPAGGGMAVLPATAAFFRQGGGWIAGLLWLLFALLLFAVFFVLLSGCGVGPRWLAERSLVNFCPLPIVDDLQDERELLAEQNRTDLLEEELYRIRLEIAQREVRCRREARLIPPILPRDEDRTIVVEDDRRPPEEEQVAVVDDPDAVVPDTIVPDIDDPAIDDPDGVVPEAVDPEAPDPEVPDPDAVDPEAVVPDEEAPVTDPEVVDDTAVPEEEREEPVEVADVPDTPEEPTPDEPDVVRPTPDEDTPEAVEPPEDAREPTEEENAAFDERLDREGGERGRVNVTLAWDSDADLDLRVTCPNGQEIFFNQRGACGGALDVDMNAVGGGGPMSDEPVENVVWDGSAAPGRYIVRVDNYDSRSDGDNATPFRLRITNGDESEIIEGSIREDDGPVAYYEFVVP